MAFIKGLMSTNERTVMLRRGWDLEVLPDVEQAEGSEDIKECELYVDSDMFEILDGNEWDGGAAVLDTWRRLWRKAVSRGKTDLEFRAWSEKLLCNLLDPEQCGTVVSAFKLTKELEIEW